MINKSDSGMITDFEAGAEGRVIVWRGNNRDRFVNRELRRDRDEVIKNRPTANANQRRQSARSARLGVDHYGSRCWVHHSPPCEKRRGAIVKSAFSRLEKQSLSTTTNQTAQKMLPAFSPKRLAGSTGSSLPLGPRQALSKPRERRRRRRAFSRAPRESVGEGARRSAAKAGGR